MKVTTEDVTYEKKVIKRMILLCWFILIICFLVKLFGSNFFNIVCNSQTFINLCNYIDNSFWYYIVGFIFYYLSGMLLWFAMKKTLKCSKKDFILLSSIIFISFVIQYIFKEIGFLEISFIITTFRMIIIPLLLFRINWKNVLFINLIDLGFQLISAFTKNVPIENTIYETALVCLIFLIDYYIMTILLYLYCYYFNEEKECIMGFAGTWFLHKELAELKAILPTLKNEREIELCKKRIAKLEAKENEEDKE